MIGPEITVPDVTEAVVGYRQFAMVRHQQHNFQLVSPHQGEPWQTVEKTAKCMREITVPEGIVLPRPPKPHKAPHKGCGCGIYVYFDPNPVGERPDSMLMHPTFGGPLWAYANKVQALMSLSGTIEVHSRGMRAERGRICAFGDNPQLANDERAALHELARQFGVPVVPECELPKLSTEYGRPLDKTLRPEPEPTLHPKALSYEWGPTTPARRRRWTAFIPSGINGSAAALNFTLTAIHFAPLSLGCAAASTAMAVLMYPKDKGAAR